ncbi:MAG: 4-hydroxythreonine-4-phosphate dehydrogenase PdxA [Alistipes sp.]|nr:4-hydroxythreonine-4-phosphate dehydrogenase PdxA [Alistipes sp.]
MTENLLKIGITQGDPNGIGWEVILKTISNPLLVELCTPVLYGSTEAMNFYRKTIQELDAFEVVKVASAAEAQEGRINLVECGAITAIEPGKASPQAGQAAVEALEKAAEDLLNGELDAVVTAPFDKEMVQNDNFRFTGHTEFFGAKFEGEPMMIMCSERLRVGLVTKHLPIAEIPRHITREKIVQDLRTLKKSLIEDFGVVEPRIAVLALNPHAGDGGLLGTEEQEVIRPAINEAYEEGILAFGPFAADGLFASGSYTKYDGVLAMYHDQGLAPFKTLSPDGVNLTASLSAVRTSPDHGTAFDIAGQDKADAQSMRNALYTAIDVARNRRAYSEWSANPLPKAERERTRRDQERSERFKAE